jgi:hypothetical protein
MGLRRRLWMGGLFLAWNEGEDFFFAKKKQKTFIPLSRA